MRTCSVYSVSKVVCSTSSRLLLDGCVFFVPSFIDFSFSIIHKKHVPWKKKRPYNLREKKEKKAAYRNLIRADLADELYDKILEIIVVQKKYKDSDYSAKVLAKELKTNTRYLSAVINSRFGVNYSCLLNEYRIKEAKHIMIDKRYAGKTIEEISAMVGFANRQSFYAAFYKYVGETPNDYRKKYTDK